MRFMPSSSTNSRVYLRPHQIKEMEMEQPETSLVWHDIDAHFVLRLFYALDGSMAAAMVVAETLKYHRHANSFDSFCGKSVDDLVNVLKPASFSKRTLHRAFQDLVAMGVLELKPVVRNTVRKYKIVPQTLMSLIQPIDASYPGLTPSLSKAGLGTLADAKGKDASSKSKLEAEKSKHGNGGKDAN